MNRRSVVQQRSLALALAHTELVEHARHRRARTSSCNSRSLVKVLGRRDDRRRVAACSGRLGVSFLVRARHDSAPNIMPASAERPSILLPAGWAGSGGRDGRGEGEGEEQIEEIREKERDSLPLRRADERAHRQRIHYGRSSRP